MKKLLIASTLMISSSLLAQEAIKIDKSKVISIETQNREVLTINQIYELQSNGISTNNREIIINNPDLILNIELPNGQINTPSEIIDINLNARSGGQDGGGG